MTHHMAAGRTLEAAASDARQAVTAYDNASEWLGRTDTAIGPLAAEVWVFDTKLSHVLLVNPSLARMGFAWGEGRRRRDTT